MGIWAWLKGWLSVNWSENLLTVVGYGFTLAAAALALLKWREDQKWRRKEALLARIDSFFLTPGSRNAMMMLSSHDREIPLWNTAGPAEQYIRVTLYEVGRALMTVPPGIRQFDPKANAIRDSFEDFLSRLSRLEHLLKEKMFSKEEASTIMGDWVKRIGVTHADERHVRNLRLYIEWRGMRPVQELFARFGVDLTSSLKQDRTALEKEVEGGDWAATSDILAPETEAPAGDVPEQR